MGLEEAKQTEIGITGGGKDNHMLYLNGLETEKVMTKDMINKIVTLVEEKASNYNKCSQRKKLKI